MAIQTLNLFSKGVWFAVDHYALNIGSSFLGDADRSLLNYKCVMLLD